MNKVLSTKFPLDPQDIDTSEKKGSFLVCILGCGQKGINYALAFAEAGFKVSCVDVDQSVIKEILRGHLPINDFIIENKFKKLLRNEKISASSEIEKYASKSNMIIITIGIKVEQRKGLDYSDLERVCKQVGAIMQKGCIVIYGGEAGFGLTDGVVRESLENASGLKAGEHFGLAYNPILIPPSISLIGDQNLNLAAKDKYSLNSAATVFETITKKGVKKIKNLKTAEAAALFVSAKLNIHTALNNELAVFCEKADVNYFEIIKLFENDSFQMNCLPTISIDPEITESYVLLESAENINTKIRLLSLAKKINNDMIKHAVNLTQDALRACGKPLRRSKIALLGNSRTGTPASVLAEMLETKGSKINFYDPNGYEKAKNYGPNSIKKTLNDAVEGTDGIIIVAEQDQIKRLNLKRLRALMKKQASIIDLTGIVDPVKAEKAGLIFRGIGRGTRK